MKNFPSLPCDPAVIACDDFLQSATVIALLYPQVVAHKVMAHLASEVEIKSNKHRNSF